jgi:hypothetical protein
MTRRRLLIAIGATLAALLGLVAFVLFHAVPSSEAVRLRNSLLILPADPSVGEWTPEDAPATFLFERRPVPDAITAAAQEVLKGVTGSDLDKARALSAHLTVRLQDKGPIQSLDLAHTYRAIMEEGQGYCSDIIDAYMALMHAAGLPVRPWAFSFDGFGGHGHIVVEVYTRDTQRWVMLDVFNNVMPLAARSGETMSARQFVEAFRTDESSVKFVPIGPGRPGYRYDDKLRAYYRWGIDEWYLWNGNNVVSRAANHAFVGWLADIAEPLGELASIAFGDFPKIVPLKSSTNNAQVEHMLQLRNQLLLITAVCVALTIALVVEMIAFFRTRSNARRHAR